MAKKKNVAASSDTAPNTDKKEKKNTPMQEFLSWVEVIVIAVVLAFAIDNFIIINATIPSGSMEKTIMTGDRVLGLRLTYLFNDPQRGDIVVFKYPIDEAEGKNTKYIKRIIGLPGETVEIRDAKIYINGSDTPLEENYLWEDWTVENDGFTFEIPDDCYLMLGDNRNNSSDSRYWNYIAVREGLASDLQDAYDKGFCFVHRKKILGKAYFRYWPLNHMSGLY